MAESLYSDDQSTEQVSTKKTKEDKLLSTEFKNEPQETLLQKLSSTIASKVSRKDVFINVPERPRVTLRISPNVSQAQVRSPTHSSVVSTHSGCGCGCGCG